MAQFSKIRLTKQGLEMLALVQLGASLTFTEVAVGDGYITEETDVLSLTSLISPVSADIAIAANTFVGNSQTKLTARLKSGENAFFLREIGIYAKINDGEAALYAYANAGDNADYIPAAGGASSVIQDLNLFTVVGNAENVSAVIKTEIGVQRGEFEGHINSAELDHADGSVTTRKIADSSITAEKIASNAVPPDKLGGNMSGYVYELNSDDDLYTFADKFSVGESTDCVVFYRDLSVTSKKKDILFLNVSEQGTNWTRDDSGNYVVSYYYRDICAYKLVNGVWYYQKVTARSNISLNQLGEWTEVQSLQSDIYSEYPKKIGTWLDGKGIYRICFECTMTKSDKALAWYNLSPTAAARLAVSDSSENVKCVLREAYSIDNGIFDEMTFATDFLQVNAELDALADGESVTVSGIWEVVVVDESLLEKE